ncbi:ATP-dependent DNA helicase DinG [Aromatoleum evansii]|uniref:ATP-dependent DNA helicase DinG n=1 Tax=Aromatoleum evansii TaxID=59406 RepID=UPI00145D3B98|nr:ATP-dependent DNA helicase DinG [Aromatoleum evansii]NMG28397.1 ATP-dependent DNA helicase DinG [Aromatoleum evansii]
MLTEDMKSAVRAFYSRVSTELPGFKPRVGQREMIAAISNALGRARLKEDEQVAGQNIVVVEGRTGVGKTVGYLVPALALAKQLDKKVIVSTGTVALQEQLATRDVPAMVALLGRPVTTHLSKGRRRYVCTSRLHALAGDAEQEGLFGDAVWDRRPEEREITMLRDMRAKLVDKAWSGDRDALSDAVPDDLWARISTDSPGCTGRRCPAYHECPFQISRAAMLKADVIVANHDYVLSCLASNSHMLPELKDAIIVFDEAHHLPKVAISRFAQNAHLVSATKWIERAPSLLGRVSAMLPDPITVNALSDCAKALVNAMQDFATALKRSEAFSEKGVLRYPFGQLDPGSAELARRICTHADEFHESATMITEAFAEALEKGRISATSGEVVLRDLSPLVGRIDALAEFWTDFCAEDGDGEPTARWVERRDEGRDYVVNLSPISAARTLYRHVWTQAASVVLASATIRTLGNFNSFLRDTGLSTLPEVMAVAVTSPFNYPEQGELHIPRMKADPKNAAAHTQEIIQVLPSILERVDAGALMLFASRRQMEDVYKALPRPIQVDVLMQGTKSRPALLAEHIDRVSSGSRSILFGLSGLGEGLDLPGRLCEHVIIAKLPFAPPDSPLEEAISEWIESRGGNPFSQIFLPNASLILVQWVGRLIRKEEDRGRITILDSRIVSKGYGRQLIAGLPEFRRVA